jgi:hypothetical protein
MAKKTQKRKRTKVPEYPGELGRKIKPGRFLANMKFSELLLPSFYKPIPNMDFLKMELAADREKLFLLMDHFGIDRDEDNEDRWLLLAFALARNHVPAFQNMKNMGRPKEKEYDPLRLYCDVHDLMDRMGFSVSSAAAHLRRNKYPNKSVKTVEGWYYESVEVWDEFVRDCEAGR